MSKIAQILIAVALTFSFLASCALALTSAEIEAAWANAGRHSGTFTERYSDGSGQTGKFTVYDPTLVHLTYENGTTMTVNGGASRQIGNVTAHANLVTVIDGFNGAVTTYQLGPFGELFNPTPDLSRIQAGTGENSSTTVIRMHDPRAPNQGYVDVYFDNSTGLMLRWKSNIDGLVTQTDFRY